MKKNIHYMTVPFEFKGVHEEKAGSENLGRVEGYASVFNNVDLGLDVVVKGAFKKTLKDNKGKVIILADHDPSKPIGWNTEGVEDEYGLKVKGDLNLDVQLAKERYSLAKQAFKIGAPTGLSIGYTTIKSEPDGENPRIRRLTELKLWEYSFVTFPMNMEAMLTAAKSIGGIDKAQFLIQQLKHQGVSLRDFEQALHLEAAAVGEDPVMIGQSLDNLLAKFRT